MKQFDLLKDYEEAIRFTMDYIDENDYIINCVYDSIGREEMKRFFYSDFIAIIVSLINEADEKTNTHLEPDFKEFLANFFTEALSGTLLNYAKEKENRDKEKTIRYLNMIIEKNISILMETI